MSVFYGKDNITGYETNTLEDFYYGLNNGIPDYTQNGANWQSDLCQNGQNQSPINLYTVNTTVVYAAKPVNFVDWGDAYFDNYFFEREVYSKIQFCDGTALMCSEPDLNCQRYNHDVTDAALPAF